MAEQSTNVIAKKESISKILKDIVDLLKDCRIVIDKINTSIGFDLPRPLAADDVVCDLSIADSITTVKEYVTAIREELNTIDDGLSE